MGQYFGKWLDQEGLIPENTIPEAGEVRFNAREKQRCRATARYFAAGLFPLADIEVEYPGDDKGTVDFMNPVLHFYTDAYAQDAAAQVAARRRSVRHWQETSADAGSRLGTDSHPGADRYRHPGLGPGERRGTPPRRR